MRVSRFSPETARDNKAMGLVNLPTKVTALMTNEELVAYAIHVRLEEIGQKLRIGDVVPQNRERSPSPPPQYDSFGKRTNTREIRYRKRLEDERHRLVEGAMRWIPDFRPPSDYRRPIKTQEKIYLPVNDYPEINFIGLLIGPRGNTLKKMETESGAKIAIRGKGSVKEGKGRSDAVQLGNLEEDLHCLIMGETEDKVRKAVELVEKVIETASTIPETQNDLKRSQLRELATLNGTLRDDEGQLCQNCGAVGHRKYDCPEIKNFTANVVCRICGSQGHIARDCPQRNDPGFAQNINDKQGPAVDQEYRNLMLELGGEVSMNHSNGPMGAIEAGPGGGSGVAPWRAGGSGATGIGGAGGSGVGSGSSAPPWRASGQTIDTSSAAPWKSGGAGGDSSAPPPWRNAGQGGGDMGGGQGFAGQNGMQPEAFNPSTAPWRQAKPANQQYTNQPHTNQPHTNQHFNNHQYTNQQYTNQQYTNQQYNNQQYNNQQYNNQQQYNQ